MSYYENRLRLTTTTPAFIQSCTFAFGTVMFAVSIFATLKEALFPSKRDTPLIVLRLRKGVRVMQPDAQVSTTLREAAVLICREGSYSLAMPETKQDLHVPSGATALIVDSRHSLPLTPHVHNDRGSAVLRRRSTTSSIPDLRKGEAVPGSSSEAQPVISASPEPIEEQQQSTEEQQSAQAKKSGVLARLPHTLRLKSKKSSDSGGHPVSERKSTSRHQSPMRRLFPKSEPEEPADAHGRIPYRRNPDDVERLTTTFVNPFRFNTKRSRHGSTASMPEGPTSGLPLTPETSSPRRNSLQSIATYMKHAVQPRSSLYRRSFPPRTGSSTSSSSECSPASASCRSSSLSSSSSARSHSDRDLRKAQPHASPYDTVDTVSPNDRPKSRRSFEA